MLLNQMNNLINNPLLLIILGLKRQPKWGHLKDLHAAIKLCSTTLLQGVRTNYSLGQQQEVMCQKSSHISLNVLKDETYKIMVTIISFFPLT